MKRWAAVSPIEKRICHHFVHCLSEVSSIPVDIHRGVGAGGGGRRAAGVEDVEVVGAAAIAAASLVLLFEPIFSCISQNCDVHVVVVCIEDD